MKMAGTSLQFGVEQWRTSRLVRALAAALLFLFMLHPCCPIADAAEAAPAVQKTDQGAGGYGDDHPAQGDMCPSLDHTPVFPPDTGLSPAGDAPAKPRLARFADLGAIAGIASWAVTSRATPPPIEPFPLYLRYAHLLI